MKGAEAILEADQQLGGWKVKERTGETRVVLSSRSYQGEGPNLTDNTGWFQLWRSCVNALKETILAQQKGKKRG